VVYYFSEAGVQQTSDGRTQRNDLEVRAAIKSSWVLIDVDIGSSPSAADWYPREWIKPCTTLVWTSSPRQERLRRFRSRFRARLWYMSPWSLEEIAVVTCVLPLTPLFGISSVLTLPNKANSRRRTPRRFKPDST
jgi:hypothetical protein